MRSNLSSSLEDYLETILDIHNQGSKVRITDISNALHVEKPSVHYAVSKLKNLNLVLHNHYEDIILTPQGFARAKQIKQKHNVIYAFLNNYLGVSSSDAEKEACRIEHIIGPITMSRLSMFLNYLEQSRGFNTKRWLEFYKRQTGENLDMPLIATSKKAQ